MSTFAAREELTAFLRIPELCPVQYCLSPAVSWSMTYVWCTHEDGIFGPNWARGPCNNLLPSSAESDRARRGMQAAFLLQKIRKCHMSPGRSEISL